MSANLGGTLVFLGIKALRTGDGEPARTAAVSNTSSLGHAQSPRAGFRPAPQSPAGSPQTRLLGHDASTSPRISGALYGGATVASDGGGGSGGDSIWALRSGGAALTKRDVSGRDKVVARFQRLKNMQHHRLCQYVDVVAGWQPGKLYVVSEHYRRSARDAGTPLGEAVLRRVAYEVLQGLAYLHDNGVVHRNLNADNVLLDAAGHVKLADYGLYDMTASGYLVDFAIGRARYLSPEVIRGGPNGASAGTIVQSSPKADIWSLGVLLAELASGRDAFDAPTTSATMHLVLQLCGRKVPTAKLGRGRSSTADSFRSRAGRGSVGGMGPSAPPVVPQTAEEAHETRVREWLSELGVGVDDGVTATAVRSVGPEIFALILACLAVDPAARPSASALLQMDLFAGEREASRQLAEPRQVWLKSPHIASLAWTPRSGSGSAPAAAGLAACPLDGSTRPAGVPLHYAWPSFEGHSLSELVHFWKLADGDLEEELFLDPAIHAFPAIVRTSGTVDTVDVRDAQQLHDSRILPLHLDALVARLSSDLSSSSGSSSGRTDMIGGHGPPEDSFYAVNRAHASPAERLPPVSERRRNDEYRASRERRFAELLRRMPASKHEVIREARRDIPVSLRASVWSAILGVQGDVETLYAIYDHEKETPLDRQIDVDIPRCHQEDAFLSSADGHRMLRRILKTWVAANPHLRYWQGLDHLAAPFVKLMPGDEARVFCCLQELVAKYLHSFNVPGSTYLQRHLRLFAQVMAYHDPQVAAHLDTLAFRPELYAMPWFLTLFAHVLPLDKVADLWDALLLGSPMLPLFMAVALVSQLRRSVLALDDFQRATGFFAAKNMPDVDVDRLTVDGLDLSHRTPPSIYNALASAPLGQPLGSAEQRLHVPELDVRDLELHRHRFVVVDLRTRAAFASGHFPDSVNVPVGELPGAVGSSHVQQLLGRHLVLVDDAGVRPSAADAAVHFVRGHVPLVSTLRGGFAALQARLGSLMIR